MDSDGEKEKARERWSGITSNILKLGEIESSSNVKIAKILADFPDNRGIHSSFVTLYCKNACRFKLVAMHSHAVGIL